ncbi:glycosyltransferase [Mammaliicoccus sciuri]|uniref:glycosyltransferase n=1 Tax=Mammaliicoccus sciuri TaxID=1296 RepID=UPI002DBD33AA|nr:glycosyltransferase [Mammaliicoccus sciuri]MEB6121388.1 glycosyltransferase family 4 protein [Mammaliicoccus sciuri]MEB6286911.1 glycosyltransferase family 4 protein [Mammaliicoccus sciuri]MEB6312359.1 glycosyltransferase family 4 protein [Mammaliicoccus sciuri]MEB6695175.1 glycosyltransferase family 4 protein [Mammaliicoccus sciuri]
MRLLWAHDHKFYNYENKVYSKVQFGQEFWDRYLNHIDQISIVSRLYDMNKEDSKNIDFYNLSSREEVSFLKANFNKKIFFKNNQKFEQINLSELVSSHEKIIVRLPSTIGNYVAIEAIKQKKEFAVELVGDPWDALINLKSIIGKMYAPIMYMKTKHIVKRAKQVLYVTDNYLQKRYINNGLNNTNASNVNIHFIDEKINKKRNDTKIINIGLIGYLSTYKGIDTAIKSLYLLNKNEEFVFKLNILGTGKKEKYIKLAKKYQMSKNLSIQTLPTGPPVYEWLDNMDIYIQPSKTEGLPRGLIEAMSRGLPAVGTNVGGIPELLNSKFIIKKGDSKGLAKVINELILNDRLYHECSVENIKKAFEYDYKIINSKRFNFYKKYMKDEYNEDI